jgi:pyruvate/2-oxoglutarate dehydrogenase complex dihydrolipoamide acyltransferase (E2) component
MSELPPPPPGTRVPVLLPDLGTPTARASIWFAEPGDHVYEGDRLLEVSVGEATFDVSAPVTGWLAERLVWPNDELRPQQILGTLSVAPEE